MSTEDRPAPTVEALTTTTSTPATEEPTTPEPEPASASELESASESESAALVDEPQDSPEPREEEEDRADSVQIDEPDSDEADSAGPDTAHPADPVVAEQDSELHPDRDLVSSDPRAATVDAALVDAALVDAERAVDPAAVAPTTPRPPQIPAQPVTRRARLPLTNALDKLVGSPQIRILGDLDVVGATGQLGRGGGGRFLLLFGTYIALHPGRTHLDVDGALWPHATGDNNSARNSAMSKLRLWIGQAPDGEMWLPRATATDGYHWHRDFLPLDWQHFLKLEARGARGDDDALLRALSLVRGRPLGNLIRSPHPWVDDLREEATARVVDVAHQLVQRSLANGNTVVAAQAIRAGMLAEPAAEILHQDAIRTAAVEHNTAKLHGAIDRAYRALDDDLSRDTIDLIAQVTESTGGVRVAAS